MLLNKARELEADYLATGHYAKIDFDESSKRYRLIKGVDPGKDQSYFLFTLTQEQLKNVLFPLGGMKKEEVRRLAQRYNLKVAEKVESQEICFIPDDNYSRFILEKATPDSVKPGDIVDTSGKVPWEAFRYPQLHYRPEERAWHLLTEASLCDRV